MDGDLVPVGGGSRLLGRDEDGGREEEGESWWEEAAEGVAP
ncbi:hypothetical protein [Streptomyces sp. NPDC050535]